MPLPFEQLKPMSGIRWIEYLAPFLCGGIVEVLFVLGATLLGWEATLLGLLIFAFYCVCAPVEKGLLVFLMLLPNQRMATLGDSNITVLNLAVLILCVKSLPLILKGRSFVFLFFSLIFSVFTVLRAYQTTSLTGLLLFFKILIELFLFAAIFGRTVKNRYWFFLCALFYVAGSIIMGVGEVFRGEELDSVSRLGMGENRVNDPNIMGNSFSFSIAMILLILSAYKGKLVLKFFLEIAMCVLLILGILTVSRAFFLAVVLTFLGYTCVNLFNGKQIKNILLISTIVGFLIVLSVCAPDAPLGRATEYLQERILTPRKDDISGGRFDIWAEYWDLFTKDIGSILFGIEDNRRTYGLMATHNAFLGTLTSNGLAGCVCLLVMLGSLFRELYLRYKCVYGKPSLLGAMLVCLLFVNWMTLSNLLDMNSIACMFIACSALFIQQYQKDYILPPPGFRKLICHENSLDN